MSTDYNYDEQGQFFPYFITTITGLITIPLTYSLLKPSKELENTAPRIQSDFKPEHADLIEAQRRKQRRRERKSKRIMVAVGGWVVMAWMVYLMIVTARVIPQIWDPYEVLGVSRNADEKQIKSHYRRLSVTQHPDKVQPDPSNNVTMDTINEHWVEITKAFKALTDEEVRNNYLQYGHPDGKQSFSIGIALPQLLVTEGNGKYVLLVYGALLGILLPYVVGKWWYGTQRVTREKVLVSSAGNLFREYHDNIDESGLVATLSSGDEYKDILTADRAEDGLSKLEKAVLGEGTSATSPETLTGADRSKLEQMDEGVRRKTLGLLWAYLRRVKLADKTLDSEKYDVAPTAVQLIDSFLAIANAYSNIGPLLAAYRTQQLLIQAMPPGSSPLLQLPHFNTAVVRSVEGEHARTHLKVQEFMQMSDGRRRSLAVGKGLLSDEQYKRAVKVASQLPLIHVEKAFFKVTGERFIFPSSLVSLVVKARIVPPGSQHLPPVKETDLEDVDPAEGDLDALHGRRKKGKFATAMEGGEEHDRFQPPLAHSPYYARDHSPRWHLFLSDGKQGKISVPATTFSTFDKPLFDEAGKPTYNVQTIKMQFGAPPQPGQYTFAMTLVCDSYVGLDTRKEVTLVVDEPSKAEEAVEEEEISEPEEDSIAGQMTALKGGATKRRKHEDPSDDESDTEGEEQSGSDTDTDTDTDTDDE